MSVTAAPPTVRFRDLGTLLVEHDGDLRPVGGARLDSALAVLLVHADRRVGPEVMAAALWGVDAPPRSSSTLDSHVWRLRRVLEPHRARGVPSSLLLSDHGGYRLVVTVDQVDSLRFEQLAADAADLLAGGQPDRALRRADQALALWRGRPFTPVTDEPWAAATVARLQELRGQIRERRIEALIAVGDPDRALVELEPAVAEEPLREGLWAHRMWAYHRAGRTDRALAAYREVRALLRDELGVDPGAELRDVHARILADDPARGAPSRRTDDPVPPAVPVVPAAVRLPVRRTRLVGRDAELARLTRLVPAHALTTVVGAAGCGKTRLATEVARAAAAVFPDGVWFVSLTSAVDAAGVVDAVASAVGATVPAAGSARAALRAFTRDRRVLLLLDNCEHVLDAAAELVEDLLAEGSELAVLATSREPLDVDGEHVEHLHPLALPAPDARDPAAAPAVDLFLQRLPEPPDGCTGRNAEDLALAAVIATVVDGVPLALELAAARARAYTLAEIAAQVAADPSSLARIGRGPAGQPSTVREAIDGSYRLLPADEARLHRLLPAVAGPFTADLAAALADPPERDDVVDRLTRLAHRSLLEPLGPLRPGGRSRFAQLATVRGHAAHAAGREGDGGRAAADRRDRFTQGLLRRRPRLGVAAERAWLEAVDDDLAAVRATLQRTLVDAPAAAGVESIPFLALYWYYRGMFVEGRRWIERAVAEEERAGPRRARPRPARVGSPALPAEPGRPRGPAPRRRDDGARAGGRRRRPPRARRHAGTPRGRRALRRRRPATPRQDRRAPRPARASHRRRAPRVVHRAGRAAPRAHRRRGRGGGRRAAEPVHRRPRPRRDPRQHLRRLDRGTPGGDGVPGGQGAGAGPALVRPHDRDPARAGQPQRRRRLRAARQPARRGRRGRPGHPAVRGHPQPAPLERPVLAP